ANACHSKSRRPQCTYSLPTRRSSDLMNIFSREAKWYLSSNSFSWILSSARIKSLVWAVDRRRISLTSRNMGLLSTITQALGEIRSEEHTSELQSRENLVCRLLLEKKK